MRTLRTPLTALLGTAAVLLLLGLGLTPSDVRKHAEVPQVRMEQLPPEAHATLRLIERGGPFPYRRDGTVFGNRERLLPIHSHGYYREYTVPTPGARDRGARRIVAGSRDERYYTADHYRSFQRIIR